MSNFSFNGISVVGIATAVPKNVVKYSNQITTDNDEIDKFVKTTGIEEVHISDINQTASDLGFVAANSLLNEKKINREEIGCLIFGAHSTDYRRPATACVLHKRLNLSKNCAAFDVSLGCSAFIYTIQIAASMMLSSNIQKGLVIVGETVSKLANKSDKSVSRIFGDAGSAILLEKKDGEIKGSLYSDGNGYKSIIAPAGGFRNLQASTKEFEFEDNIKRNLYNVWMDGTSVFSFTISDVPNSIKSFFEDYNKSVNDYDFFILHQANNFILKQLIKKLKLPADKVPKSLDRYGNTSAAAIPLTICDCFGEDNSNRQLKLLSSGFGVGLSWGVLSFEINTADVLPIIETDDYFKEGVILSPSDWENLS